MNPPATDPSTEHRQDAEGADKKPIGRLRRYWRTLLLRSAILAAAFLVGALVFHLMRYQPLEESLNRTQTDLSEARDSIVALQESNRDLEGRLSVAQETIESLASDNQTLQTQLDESDLHMELLLALVEVENARLALMDTDQAAAKTALKDTPQRLDYLHAFIATVDESLADSLQQRMVLILASLDGDADTAGEDLELLSESLRKAETVLFGE